ncbi:hypothetical protein D3P09_11845 [Paenibacillus pinisoli]|uniref:Uncharacterized protein n=1 Tax=Paenibacillus pinisoli TaxID=1276110 RepID=A0A3A6PTP4_9BACL|nr:hypothetical protein [Paenibacillus pinisoli]RJX40061.1 hypothetical protein D3P09_11845 [Paenibacillus pinisoli]
MARKAKASEQQAAPDVSRYTKEQLLQSRQWPGREKDILCVVLEDGKQYAIAEANKAIQHFLKREAV